jgi:hypothetical protein
VVARRTQARAGWPRGLYETRPDYYIYRSPISGRTVALGKIDLAEAKAYAALQNRTSDDAKFEELVQRVRRPHDSIDSRGLFTAEHIAKKAMVFDRICGVYFLLKDDEIVYIGQSISVLTRLGEHKRDITKEFNRVYVIECPVGSLSRFEAMYIDKFKPKHNASVPTIDATAPLWEHSIRAILGDSIHVAK